MKRRSGGRRAVTPQRNGRINKKAKWRKQREKGKGALGLRERERVYDRQVKESLGTQTSERTQFRGGGRWGAVGDSTVAPRFHIF